MTADRDRRWSGETIKVRRSRRYTWMLNGWTNATLLHDRGGGTEFVTIGVPDDFFAVRVGFANMNTVPWTVSKMIACASSSWNDAFNPTEETDKPRPADAWSTLTFQNGGLDSATLITAAAAPTEITVWGNVPEPACGEQVNPSWTFTDWTPCVSAGADPTTGMRILMLRALVPGGQTVTFTNGRMSEYSATPRVHRGYRYFTGGLKGDVDLVNNAAPDALPGMTAATIDGNHLVNGQLICFIQVLTRNAGIVGLITGDSHQAGTTTTSGVNNFLVQCLLEIGQSAIGTVPVGVASTGVGGLSSEQFFPRMTALLYAVRPAFVFLPCWSFNERDGDIRANAAAEDVLLARMILAAEQVRAAGALPIFLTPFPRDGASMTRDVKNVWLARREAIQGMRATNECVFDATPLLGATHDGELTGMYLDGLSSDTIHPNDAGHAVMARALTPFLLDLIGLPKSRTPPLNIATRHITPQPATPPAVADDALASLLSRLRWHEG